MVPVHFTIVLLAAIAAFVIGFLAHGPVTGKLWMKLANIQMGANPPKLSSMIPQMLANFVANIVCAYVIAVAYLFMTTSSYGSAPGVWSGVVTAFWLWLGVNLTVTVLDVIWMGKSKSLWLFEAVASLVGFAAMGAIIAAW